MTLMHIVVIGNPRTFLRWVISISRGSVFLKRHNLTKLLLLGLKHNSSARQVSVISKTKFCIIPVLLSELKFNR